MKLFLRTASKRKYPRKLFVCAAALIFAIALPPYLCACTQNADPLEYTKTAATYNGVLTRDGVMYGVSIAADPQTRLTEITLHTPATVEGVVLVVTDGGTSPNGTSPNSASPNSASPNGTSPNGTSPNGTSPNSADETSVYTVYGGMSIPMISASVRELVHFCGAFYLTSEDICGVKSKDGGLSLLECKNSGGSYEILLCGDGSPVSISAGGCVFAID